MSNLVGNVFDSSVHADADGNVEIDGSLTVKGATTTVSTTNTVVKDKLIELGNGSSGSASGDAGIIVERGSDTNAGLVWDESTDTWVACTTSATGASTGNLTITDAALKASVITASTSLTLASGATVTAINDEDAMGSNSATALATQQSIKAYVDSQTSGAGNMDNWILEDDDGTEVTVSNGKEVKFIGSGLTTNFTDTSDGSDADPFDLTFTVDAAQTGITSVVNTSLEIGRDADNRIRFGTDNQIIFKVDGGDNVIFKTSGEIEATSLDISGDADIDGTLEADAITVDGTALNEYIADTVGAMVGSNTESGITVTYQDGDNTLDFTVGTLNQDTTGTAAIATTVTCADESSDTSCFVGYVTAATGDLGIKTGSNLTFNSSNGTLACTALDISGDADIDGTLEADAITVDGTALNEYIADTVGAMVGSNTETSITVSYDDADNTLDFVVAAVGTNEISDDAVTLDKMAGLARGKIIVGDSSGNPVALALGNDTQVLTSDGTDIVWANASGGSVSNDDANLILAVQSFS